MNRKYLTTLVLLTIAILLCCCSNKEISCVIKGRVVGRNSDTILIHKFTDDVRFVQTAIPIKDSTFEYHLTAPDVEAYELIFQDEMERGAWKPIYIFPENGIVNCTLYSFDQYDKNRITGGKLNEEYSKFQDYLLNEYMKKTQPINDSVMALFNRNEYFSQEMSFIMNDLRNAKDDTTILELRNKLEQLRESGNDLTPAGRAIVLKGDSLRQEMFNWRSDYIKQNPTIISYFFLLQDLQQIEITKLDLFQAKNSFATLSGKYPNHPYTQIVKNLLDSNEKIKIGGTFIDFTLPDIDGRLYTLSEVIKDKIALIDLWASWCGPCIMNSRSMIPVYEEFKDKGFTICAVAAEIKNTNQLKIRLEKEKFPWINLVDLDNKNQIWYKYGVPNSGGGTFLVDAEGKIIAINPTADEVKNILTEKLK